MDKEAIELCYNGKTITAYVDKNMAEMLRNDPAKNEYYSKTVLEALEKKTDIKLVQVIKPDANVSYELHENSNSGDKFIWNKDATALMVKLRGEMKSAFEAKSCVKKILWGKIATELENAGFDLGENAAEKCRQKFVNLRHQYFNHLQHMYDPQKKRKRPQNKYHNFFEEMQSAPEKPKKPPPFFEEMQSILGDESTPAKIPKSENVYQIEYYNKTLEEFLDDDSQEMGEEEHDEDDSQSQDYDKNIWSVGAINLLIRFRGELDNLFQERKMKRRTLWAEIGRKMKVAGFDLGEDIAKRCQMKFENLQAKYEAHKALSEETGTKPTMPFYEELHKILDKPIFEEIEEEQDLDATSVCQEDILGDDNCETIILQTVSEADGETTFTVAELMNSTFTSTEAISQEPDKSLWDRKAVLLLIKLREEFAPLFDARIGQKKNIWNQVANRLNAAGHNIGNGERCRQKFANLQQRYFHHLACSKTNNKKSPPPFFEEMKVLMKKLGKTKEDDDDDSGEDIRELKSNPFVQKKRFKGDSERLIDVIIKLHREAQKERRQQFSEIKALLKKQTDQTERLLNFLEQSICTT